MESDFLHFDKRFHFRNKFLTDRYIDVVDDIEMSYTVLGQDLLLADFPEYFWSCEQIFLKIRFERDEIEILQYSSICHFVNSHATYSETHDVDYWLQVWRLAEFS